MTRAFPAPSLCLGCVPPTITPRAVRCSCLLACRQTLHRLRLEGELGLAWRQGPANFGPSLPKHDAREEAKECPWLSE